METPLLFVSAEMILNEDRIVILPYATSYLIGLVNGDVSEMIFSKYYFPLSQKALKLDYRAIPKKASGSINWEEVSFVIAKFDAPYNFNDVLLKIQRSGLTVSTINPQVTLKYIEEQKEVKLTSTTKINLLKICNFFHQRLDYVTLTLVMKNDEIMSSVGISSRSLSDTLKVMVNLGLIAIEKRSFKSYSLPQRFTFTTDFFIKTLALSEEELSKKQKSSLETINQLIAMEFQNFNLIEKQDEKSYQSLFQLIESYIAILEKNNAGEINSQEAMNEVSIKVSDIITSFIERKKVRISHNITKVQAKGDEIKTQPYTKKDVLIAYDHLEKSMINTKAKAKKLLLSSELVDPKVIKALSYIL